MEKAPLIQGMRASISSRLPAQDHILKSAIGTLVGCEGVSKAAGGWYDSSSSPSKADFARRAKLGVDLGGNARESIDVLIINRIEFAIMKPHWITDQNASWICELLLLVVGGTMSEPVFKLMLGVMSLDSEVFIAPFVRTNLVSMIRISNMSHGSDNLLTIRLPITSSENICPTNAVKHSFSRSSVGRRSARTP